MMKLANKTHIADAIFFAVMSLALAILLILEEKQVQQLQTEITCLQLEVEHGNKRVECLVEELDRVVGEQ